MYLELSEGARPKIDPSLTLVAALQPEHVQATPSRATNLSTSTSLSPCLVKITLEPLVHLKVQNYITTRGPWTATPALIKVEERGQN